MKIHKSPPSVATRTSRTLGGLNDALRCQQRVWELQLAERELLRDALAELPVEQQRAIVLATYFGRTAGEIGQLEGVPLGTAKTRIRTALTRLRATLEEEEVADER